MYCIVLSIRFFSSVEWIWWLSALELVEADRQRGIETKIIHIDNEDDIREAGNKILMNTSDTRENKESIDAVFNSLNLNYLVIV